MGTPGPVGGGEPGVSVGTPGPVRGGQPGPGSLGSLGSVGGGQPGVSVGTPGLGLAGGSRCLTLARRRAGEAAPAWRVADHGALLQACGVRRRSSKEAQQRVVVAQGREGADSQLHLGKGRAAHARMLRPRPGVRATSRPSPTRGTCPLLGSLAALLNVDPYPLESPLEPNSVSPAWDPLGSLLGLPWILRGTPGHRGPHEGWSPCAQARTHSQEHSPVWASSRLHNLGQEQPCLHPGPPHSPPPGSGGSCSAGGPQ